jgi:DNA-binding PucR family transcriptional regulator
MRARSSPARPGSIPDTDRDVTLDTVRALVAADMNIARAARALFVQPNTVRYRLIRIADATGYDLRTFSGLVNLKCVLALA